MATYKELRGVNIQSLDADPTAVEGDVWYNASTSKLLGLLQKMLIQVDKIQDAVE